MGSNFNKDNQKINNFPLLSIFLKEFVIYIYIVQNIVNLIFAISNHSNASLGWTLFLLVL